MSIRSRKEILDQAANEEGASNEAILMAALNESQEEYRRLSEKILAAFHDYNSRLEAIEAAVRASNVEKAQDYTKALKGASETILGDIQGELEALKGEVQETVLSLQGAREKKEKSETLEMVQFLGGVFLAVAAAFYVALLFYGWWYDIPEAVGKLDAINNGIWQLLNRP